VPEVDSTKKHDLAIGMRSISVSAPARLHFGLVELCPGEPNQFGGIGLMIDSPPTRLRAHLQRSSRGNEQDWYLRAQKAAKGTAELLGLQLPVLSWYLDSSPGQHVGLGSGTQLAAATASLTLAFARSDQAFRENRTQNIVGGETILARDLWRDIAANGDVASVLAECTSRGNRSHIGLHGFLHGGFIVDLGRQFDDVASGNSGSIRNAKHFNFPEDWRILLVTPQRLDPVYGQRESDWIQYCGQSSNPDKQRMLELISDSIVPNLKAGGFVDAAQGLYEYSVLAGNLFSPIQKGIYRDATTAEVVAAIRKLGITAVGQSSWGPTVFALLENSDQADWLFNRLQEQFPIENFGLQIVGASRHGATISPVAQAE
jgi:beta-ribofuranosylaminobenzene 5'-phosphate synthase